MIYGKISNTFELLTEETAIKWRLAPGTLPKVATTSTIASLATKPAVAGSVVAVTQGNMASAVTGTSALLKGVLFDTYCTDLDDTQGSGYLTVILGSHVGRTNQVAALTATTTGAAGSPLYVTSDSSDTDTGKFKTSGTGVAVAYVLSYDGTYVTYLWVGGHQA